MFKVMLSLISAHETERHEERDGPVDFSELRDLDGLLVLEAVLVYDAVAEAIGVYPKSVIRISLCRTAKRNPLIFPI